MLSTQYTWFKIAHDVHAIAFEENNIAVAVLRGKKICIGRFKDKIYAFAYACPHAGGMMSHGYIDAQGNVVCPLHDYKFCMKNGHNVSGEGYRLKHWPVEINEEGVFVGIEESAGFWGWAR